MKVKSKLEQTVDEIESAYENEKRQKMELEKQRRRLEGDLKICQQTLSEMERTKQDIRWKQSLSLTVKRFNYLVLLQEYL